MAIKDIVIKLSAEEVLRLTRILLDEDREEAVLFLKESLKPQFDTAKPGITECLSSRLRISLLRKTISQRNEKCLTKQITGNNISICSYKE